jgi:hypothetical protein
VGRVVNLPSGTHYKTRTRYDFEEITDWVAVGDNHPLTIHRYSITGLLITGQRTSGVGSNTYRYIAYPALDPAQAGLGHVLLTTPTDNMYATQLLAMTNPSRSVVDLPVFIAELKDIPMLFKIVGKTGLETAAKGNLSFWFGWKPLVGDIMKFLDFSSAVNQRVKELEALYRSGLSRTRNLDSYTGNGWWSGYANTTDFTVVSVTGPKVTVQKVWGHCKWKPTSLPPKTKQDMINLARRAALGLTIDPATFWELIPFSWMIDWASNIGSYLQAQRNIVGAVAYDISIMRQTTTVTTLARDPANSYPNVDITSGTITKTTKTRATPSASLSAYLPFLSVRQLSILGSLWVLRSDTRRKFRM